MENESPRSAQEDPELINWLINAQAHGGSFIQSLADAGIRADWDNYRILRPVLLQMKQKYPNYDR